MSNIDLRHRIAGIIAAIIVTMVPTIASAAISDAEASAVASTYAEALRAGDIDQLDAITDGELKDKRNAVWSSPGYSDELRETYGGATISIVSIRRDGRDAALVKLQIQYAGGLPMYRELTITDLENSPGRYRVIGEGAATR